MAGSRAGYQGLIDDAHLDGLSVDARQDVWVRILADGDYVLLAQDDAQMLGFVAFGPARDADLPGRTGEVYALYVDPAVWGRGTGRRLLEAAVRELAAAGRDDSVLWVFEDNVRARTFYERCGWIVDGARKVEEHGGAALAEVRYRKA